MEKYKILDLFSGLGGFSLGLERTGHFETVAFCDNNQYSKLILDKHWKGVKIYDDVREISKEKFREDGIEFPDIITGGFPCQPFSVAGKQKGTSDDRHLWPEMFRIIKAFKPRYVIGENVRGIVNIQEGVVFETVCTDLESEGYEVQPFIIPAAGVGAPHRRERVWIIANRERSNVVNTVGNDERQKISRSDEETRGIQEEHRTEHSTTGQSSRTSAIRNGDNGYESMENPNNNGLEGRLSETRNEIITGKESSVNGSENTDNSSRRSDGRRDQSQPRINGTVQGLRDGNEEELTKATRVRGLHEGTNDSSSSIREDRNQEDDNRTLVQTRQGGVQSSEHRGLGTNQTSLNDNQVRQGDDNTTLNRMERGDKDNVADTNDEGVRTRIGGSDNDHETESRSWRADGTRSTSDDERHNSTSTEVEGMDVADTESIGTREPREFDQAQRSEGSGSTQLDGSSTNDANSDDERLQRQWQGSGQFSQTINSTSESSDRRQGSVGQGWWSVEPNVGRVAHGVPGRVHRLKGLGNSIVPQIVEEIGKAIIQAEKE
jgi:DNA-cytosine methyltransferase